MKASAAFLALASTTLAADLPSIVMKGSKLFYENGTQFFMKGIAYQQDTAAAGGTFTSKNTFIDPLADADACKRDVPLLEQLGTNIIRTYAIDPTADHSDCMQMLNDAGIYVISDLGQPALSINRDNPQWNVELFQRYKDVVDELGKYPNVVGFFAGNEVSNNATNTGASAWVKAAVRDTKAYIKQTKSRWMGVGYAANDDVDIRDSIAYYFNCGKDEDKIDFWGYNIYSWCGESNPQDSGYDLQAEFFSNYSVPVFFAEYGCNKPNGAAGRIWEETTYLYEKTMTDVFSGGIVYMYFEEANDYGLVKLSGDSVSKLKDFGTLQNKVKASHPKGVSMSSYTPGTVTQDCPEVNSHWAASSDLPPTPDSSLCTCMEDSRACVPAANLDEDDYGDIFGFICGADKAACAGINGNATTGIYGAYSMCSDKQKLAYVLDAYYNSQNQDSSACSFKGKASTQSPKKASSCSKALASASAVNKEAATATAPVSGSDSSDSDSDDDSAGVKVLALSFYTIVAAFVGVAMVVL